MGVMEVCADGDDNVSVLGCDSMALPGRLTSVEEPGVVEPATWCLCSVLQRAYPEVIDSLTGLMPSLSSL